MSKPGGSRRRRSRPLELTVLISHAQRKGAEKPDSRENPVMLDNVMALLPVSLRLRVVVTGPNLPPSRWNKQVFG